MAKLSWYLMIMLMSVTSYASADLLPKDPTKPADFKQQPSKTSSPVAQAYTLTSLLKRDKQSWAVINGQKVTVGEEVSGATLLSISHNKVLLQVDGQDKWVPMTRPTGLKISR